MRYFRPLLLVFALFLVGMPVRAQDAEYGQTEFPNSGAEDAQAPFLEGVLMLHSFEYEDARAAFEKAQTIDSSFAMAYWGEAMTHNHPIWMEQDREAALAALRDLGPTPAAQLSKATTDREKAYLRTIHVLYGVGKETPKQKEARDDAYAKAMADLADQYPDDLNAQAFHALSILGTAHEGRDFETYMRAAAIVEEVFDENPQHPGAAHYLIHAYDDPVHAPLGLRPARVYADIAPSATHALHMPSHIFFALGQWARGAASNVDSYEAARSQSRARGEPLDGGGFHALHWLHYARLQQGQYDEARAVFDTTRRHATTPSVTTSYASYMQWYMPVAYVVETENWGQLDDLLKAMQVNTDALDTRGAVTVHVARGIAAARQENTSKAQKALASAQSALDDEDSRPLLVQVRALEGLVALIHGHEQQAVEHFEAATDTEEARPLDYGPPFPPKPVHELYGEALLTLDRPSDALEEFETALDRYPSRSISLLGKATAAARAGNSTAAATARSELEDQWSSADREVQNRLQSLSRLPSSSASDSK